MYSYGYRWNRYGQSRRHQKRLGRRRFHTWLTRLMIKVQNDLLVRFQAILRTGALKWHRNEIEWWQVAFISWFRVPWWLKSFYFRDFSVCAQCTDSRSVSFRALLYKARFAAQNKTRILLLSHVYAQTRGYVFFFFFLSLSRCDNRWCLARAWSGSTVKKYHAKQQRNIKK
jgi:hypothetical protein